MFRQMLGRANPRQHQQFWGIDGRRSDNHLGVCGNDLPIGKFNTSRTTIINNDTCGQPFDNFTIPSRDRRPQICGCSGPAFAVLDGRIKGAEPLLFFTVVIIGKFVPSFAARLNPSLS